MHRALVPLVAAFLASIAAPAAADIPPDDPVCVGKALGAECPGGTCQKSTCTRSRPDPGGGPAVTSTVPCVQCATGRAADDAKGDKKGGCSVHAPGAAPGAALALVGLAVAALARRARR